MELTIEEIHLIRLALGNLQAHDKTMLEIGEKLNDAKGQNVFKNEIEKIENLKNKLYNMIEKYYD